MSQAEAIRDVCVVGGGSAGFMAAMALKSRLPALHVRVLRSKDIGIIGVGEGSTPALPAFLHRYLGISTKVFFERVQPTWKLGLKFLWGPRPSFHYPFGPALEIRTDRRQPKPNGFYCEEDMDDTSLVPALMSEDHVFTRSNDSPVPHEFYSYHLENEKFVRFLEVAAGALGIETVDDTVEGVLPGPRGVASLALKSGRTERADLFVDCTGFASLLIGKTLGEPFVNFASSLFCERAVAGGWERDPSADPTDEVVRPYTTCRTMEAGWCWRIEHEHRVHCGYVYCPAFVGDEQAEAEFRANHPRVGPTRVVKFTSGRRARAWVGNVVAIGNANGFVEPLEATALEVISTQCINLAETLFNSDCRPRPSQLRMYNRVSEWAWESIRAFLALHYKFNTRLDTPFWRHCREATDLASAEPVVEYYRENGPDPFYGLPLLLNPQDRIGGYFTLLVGMKVPFRRTWSPDEAEAGRFDALRRRLRDAAREGFTVRQALQATRSPGWVWK